MGCGVSKVKTNQSDRCNNITPPLVKGKENQLGKSSELHGAVKGLEKVLSDINSINSRNARLDNEIKALTGENASLKEHQDKEIAALKAIRNKNTQLAMDCKPTDLDEIRAKRAAMIAEKEQARLRNH